MQAVAETPVAVVTGANRGTGLELYLQLADDGYTVVLGSRDGPRGVQAAQRLARSGSLASKGAGTPG